MSTNQLNKILRSIYLNKPIIVKKDAEKVASTPRTFRLKTDHVNESSRTNSTNNNRSK